ncbi:unnamed protein product [Schistocephalus solidus]|uniref:Reverse transcriptase domain-containing protein n=1 Tax=Schistocephalus solidus TaxID=70667 RepID=A0A183T2P4_SCHSO|nr:unnamed protein product [Schistocephalus solidus]
MTARVTDNGTVSKAFAVTNGVKQGCVLAPTLFSLIFSAILMDAYREERLGIRLTHRTVGHLHNSWRMQASTRVSTTTVHELLFADDCALSTVTKEDMQSSMDLLAAGYANIGLTFSKAETVPGVKTESRRPEAGEDEVAGAVGSPKPPSEPVGCLMWEWAHWLTGRRARLHAPRHDLAPITHTSVFTKPGDMEEPSPSDSQSTGQSLNAQRTEPTVICRKRQIDSFSKHDS